MKYYKRREMTYPVSDEKSIGFESLLAIKMGIRHDNYLAFMSLFILI